MNKEEIREYISCPQFGDDHYGEWGALRLDQRIKIKDLLDYITNLQEENERLNNIINELERYINEEYIYDELGMKIFDASKLQDKLQELKGSE